MGLEKTFYQVSESEGVVEVCATVSRPNGNLTCPISFQFDVSLSTGDNSAGIRYCSAVCLHDDCSTTFSTVAPMDYIDVSTILMFGACARRHCVNVSIVDDDVLEMTESFTVTLERISGLDSRITLDPVDGVIEITDDDGEYSYVVVIHFSMTFPLLTTPYCSDCGGSEDILQRNRGCGCRSVCYCVQPHH